MKRHNLLMLPLLLVGLLGVGTASAAAFTESNQQIQALQLLIANNDTHVGDTGSVLVELPGQNTLLMKYTFSVEQSDPISAAMFNGLLSSFATGGLVTLEGEEACGCGACTRTITRITIE